MALYFFALLPPEEIREEIKTLKLEIAEKYAARHALKLPAHITLQKPFKMEEDKEQKLVTCVEKIAEKQPAFQVNLRNFGSFPPRVIFVGVENELLLIKLFEELQETLLHHQFIAEAEKNFHPHLTLATRDLEKKMFYKAWAEFRSKEYYSSFKTEKISLMKHDGKKWQVLCNFQFRE